MSAGQEDIIIIDIFLYLYHLLLVYWSMFGWLVGFMTYQSLLGYLMAMSALSVGIKIYQLYPLKMGKPLTLKIDVLDMTLNCNQ